MKSSLAQARQVKAAEQQAADVAENNRLLLLICEKLGIEVNPEPAEAVSPEPDKIEAKQKPKK